MRLIYVLFVSGLLLFACAETNDQSDGNNREPSPEQVDEETPQDSNDSSVEELTAEEKLILGLPENVRATDWNLILVGPEHALPEDYTADLVEVDNQQIIDARIVDAWTSWKEAAQAAGHQLFFASGYRTVERQRNNFNRSVQDYLNEGYSEEEAIEKTKEYLTEPGHSEHHTGLALDIVDEEWIVAGHGLVPEYDTQASQQWMVDTMAEYGFILRYPKGKEEITGIQYESWHFRYVGEENAQFMLEHDLVLEEYIDLLNKREQAE